MLHKERSALVWLVAMVIILGAYFVSVAIMQTWQTPPSFLLQIGLLALALCSLGFVTGLERVIARAQRRPGIQSDERDELIALRASKTAYHVLLVGMVIVGCVLPFNKAGWEIVNTALLAIVISEVTRHALMLRAYRGGLRA